MARRSTDGSDERGDDGRFESDEHAEHRRDDHDHERLDRPAPGPNATGPDTVTTTDTGDETDTGEAPTGFCCRYPPVDPIADLPALQIDTAYHFTRHT